MNVKPIIFSGPMVKAILDGRKTMTRRVLNPQPETDGMGMIRFSDGGWFAPHVWVAAMECAGMRVPYATGDVLVPAVSIPSLDSRYCADLEGNIWSCAKGEWSILTGSPTSRGYLSVTPAFGGKYRTRLVHRLVCETFYGKPPPGMTQVRHLDGTRTNNAPDNLDWGTQQHNWRDRAAHGRGMGESHHASKITRAQADEIRSSSLSQRALAKKFGIGQHSIWNIKTWRNWKDQYEAAPPNAERWTRPLTLVVTDVRVQRLQDISEADAIAEGARFMRDGSGTFVGKEGPGNLVTPWPTAREAFADLWDAINAKRADGAYAWDKNPWVVALTFKPHQMNVNAFIAQREAA